MNFRIKTSPYLRDNNATIESMMRNVLIALVPVTLCAIYFYSLTYILVLITSLVTICLSEYLVTRFILKTENTLLDYTAIITAIIYSLTLTPCVPLWIVAVGGLFGIVVAKLVFGGVGNNIFNPAGIGRLFVLISFGSLLPNASTAIDAVTTATPLTLLATDGGSLLENFTLLTDQYSISDLLIGGTAGSFGETGRIAIIIGGIYLIYKKAADFRIILSSILMFVAMSFIFGMYNNLDSSFAIYQLLTGGILFGAVFMATDPVTGPSSPPARILYGILIGGISFIIRIFGAAPEGVLFAILIMNMFAPLLDHYKFAKQKLNKGWIITIGISIIILCVISMLGWLWKKLS